MVSSALGRAIVKAACIYCRLSYAPDGSVEKVERQETDGRAVAERLGWPVCCVFSDNNKSAWQRTRKRADWDRMLTTLTPDASHSHDAIIVYHGDRLIRQPWDLELLLQLADDQHLHLASASGVRDLMSEDDRFILRIEAAQACKASADTSRRVKRGWKANAEQGKPIGGGKRAFGWGVPTGRTGRTGMPIYDMTQPVPSERAVLREAVERLMAGQSQGGVVAWMSSVSTTTGGKPWTWRALQHLLEAPRIAGMVRADGVLYKASWTGVVTPEEWEDLKFVLKERSAGYDYHGRERRYLLSGIAECCNCETHMRTKPVGGRNRKNTRLYHCWNPACAKKVSRNVAHLDAYVKWRVLTVLGDPGILDGILVKDPGVAAEIVTLERRRDELKLAFAKLADHPDLDPMVLAGQLTRIGSRIQEARARQTSSERERLLARMHGIDDEGWEDTPLDVRSATVRALFRVVVLPATWRGPGFDPDSVQLIRVTT
ncbi:serine recombinase [Acrocarpospora phusangensis]|uniref:Serine recombinase n=1 Tax=Acrocarpospora phusangensis TaxID=1070424 RepID=A0A919QEN9_9ACTN|nr:recombinase family protein [Acrocarpospora phusangensis]GIH25995.1 serine recombinase [Acrocarpospora phusangensis]